MKYRGLVHCDETSFASLSTREPDLLTNRCIDFDEELKRHRHLIEARDLNDAVQLIARAPIAQVGRVEIRPIQEHKRKPVSADPA